MVSSLRDYKNNSLCCKPCLRKPGIKRSARTFMSVSENCTPSFISSHSYLRSDQHATIQTCAPKEFNFNLNTAAEALRAPVQPDRVTHSRSSARLFTSRPSLTFALSSYLFAAGWTGPAHPWAFPCGQTNISGRAVDDLRGYS